VQRAAELAKERGAKRTLPLAVSGAFHSPLMEPAARRLEQALAETDIAPPTMTLIANVSAEPVSRPDLIRRSLAQQVRSSVRWSQTMKRLVADGYGRFIEVGPGKVLSGLMKRIAPEAQVVNVSSLDALKTA
jgi:[acyl-carrier-protein] S-malonyltransferase